MLPIVFPDYVHNIETAKEYVANDYEPGPDKYIVWNEIPKAGRYIAFNQEYNNLQVTAMTREFSVVAHVVSEINGLDLNNDFGLAQRASDMSQRNLFDEGTGEENVIIQSSPEQDRMNRRLARLIDPMLYVITYCLMSSKNLRSIDIWL
uniref:Uncharacterized protein n=1 Tax=Pithovirus LCPAC403 TaxID=2506596 RepID=A0A481ZCN7_9VIRU|nr:MAG: hypothetical protein LCPAC403_03690 [Pithovirus LCPAC403]